MLYVVDDCIAEDTLKLVYIELTVIILIACLHDAFNVVIDFGRRNLTSELILHKAFHLIGR